MKRMAALPGLWREKAGRIEADWGRVAPGQAGLAAAALEQCARELEEVLGEASNCKPQASGKSEGVAEVGKLIEADQAAGPRTEFVNAEGGR